MGILGTFGTFAYIWYICLHLVHSPCLHQLGHSSSHSPHHGWIRICCALLLPQVFFTFFGTMLGTFLWCEKLLTFATIGLALPISKYGPPEPQNCAAFDFQPTKLMQKIAKIGQSSPANFQAWPTRPSNSSSSGFIANFINFTGLNIACAIMFLVRLALSWFWSCFHHTHFMIIFIQCCCSNHILCHDCHPVCHEDQQNMGQN